MATPPIITSCTKSLDLLGVFLDGTPPPGAFELEMIDAAQVPEPYYTLLVHQRDMTSTLTSFHEEEIALRVLEQRVVDGEVRRHVILWGKRSARPVEYGASHIRIDALDDSAREDVLRGAAPLGGILNAIGMHYRSCPGGFLRIRPYEEILRALELNGNKRPEWLFGRCNCLSSAQRGTLAEVVEILPPAE